MELLSDKKPLKSHLTRGAWIEMKFPTSCFVLKVSHLTRGAWIEIRVSIYSQLLRAGRTSHEVRGLKYSEAGAMKYVPRRTSHEVRGLKCEKNSGNGPYISRTSHEVRGLKYVKTNKEAYKKWVAPHTRCVD